MVPQLLLNTSQIKSGSELMPTLFAVAEHARRTAPITMLIASLAYSQSGPKMGHHRSQQVKRVFCLPPKMGHHRSQQVKRVFCLPRSFFESYYNKKDGDQATTML
jgi:hypothetical protein